MKTANSAPPRARRAQGFTLLEVGIVIAIFGILAVTIATYQVGLIRDQAATARQQRTIADAQAILEASLDFYDRTGGKWPYHSGTPTELNITGLLDATDSQVAYFDIVPTNLYQALAVSRLGISETYAKTFFPFMLTTFDKGGMVTMPPTTPVPDDYGLQLEFRVVGAGAARSIAALLPQGMEMAVVNKEGLFQIDAKIVPPYEHVFARTDGTNFYSKDLRFATGANVPGDGVTEQDRMLDDENTPDDERSGWQGIQGVDEIVFDTQLRGTLSPHPLTKENRIRGVDRVVFQDVLEPNPTAGSLAELQLMETAAALRSSDAATANRATEIGLDANKGKAEIKLSTGINPNLFATREDHAAIFEVDTMTGNPKFGVYTYDMMTGLPTNAGVVINHKNLEVPGEITLENEDLKKIICELNDGLDEGLEAVGLDAMESAKFRSARANNLTCN